MQWSSLISDVSTLAVGDARPADVNAVEYDSRAVLPGALFVAMRGEATDGNRYVRAALDAGAVAIVTDSRESFAFADARGVPTALVENGRRALATLSVNFYEHPERSLRLVGITGTNGKTTTAFLLEQLLCAAGRNTVLIGTIETHVAGEVRPSLHTTPESRDVLRVFAAGVAAGATEAVMEMSSHALQQERVWGLPVDVAVFTNLTQDHLDFHGSMDAYAAAKARLFAGAGAPSPRVAIINADDAFADVMTRAAANCAVRWAYSLHDDRAEFCASDITFAAGSTSFILGTPVGRTVLQTPLTGRVNVYNFMAAFAAALARGVPFHDLVEATPLLRPVAGRFESVPTLLGFTVVVDYAHTDDALRNLIALARELAVKGRVITVFGCGGDRDRTKRPRMGFAAGEGSDLVIVTSDNPRGEDPAAIANEALAGVRASGNTHVRVELDRAAGIALAIGDALSGDIVLLAGKGHEKTQTARGVSVPFDDVAVAAAALREREAKA